MSRVAIAASSQLAADAGANIAAMGGNAVDAAITASLVQLVTEPGIVSLAGGALIVIWPANEKPVMVDGASEMPGRAAPAGRFGKGGDPVMLPYGGGTPTTVGYGSVATPGALAGYALAADRYGRTPWKALVEPAWRQAKDGFPMTNASFTFLENTYQQIFGWNPPGVRPLLDETGALKRPGDIIHIGDLDQSLAAIAEDGVDTFYRGDLAQMIARDIDSHGGLLGLEDLAAYKAKIIPALEVELDDWRFATSATPSIGGAALAAMLLLMRNSGHAGWSPEMAMRLIEAQTNVMQYRQRVLDKSETLERDIQTMLEQAQAGPSAFASPSTVHASAVDSNGLACSITASAGYGSGVMPPGTGVWMNNSLGEAELSKRGFHAQPPGARLPSNMAPTAGRSSAGSVLSIGSPGADRITTAILQTLINFVHFGMPLQKAVNHPRLHVEWPKENEPRVAYEPGAPVDVLNVPQRQFDGLDMFFGGVGAVHFAAPDHFEMAADIRRTGGVALSS